MALQAGGDVKGIAVEVTQGRHKLKSHGAAWFDFDTCNGDGLHDGSLGLSYEDSKMWRRLWVGVLSERCVENTTVFYVSDGGHSSRCTRSSLSGDVTGLSFYVYEGLENYCLALGRSRKPYPAC